MPREEISRGAEAVIYREDHHVTKARPRKTYRHPQLDAMLRKQRTRKEAKVLQQLKKLRIPGPTLLDTDDKQAIIMMSDVTGERLRDVLDDDTGLCEHIGRHVATLHDHDLIHGDLTTSNMIRRPDGSVALIDFGLTFHSTRIEDKAVDLHLFRQALKSKHHAVADEAWKRFLKSYHSKQKKTVLQRLRVVEKRGRNKA
ncbi:Kae1-associated serine/threonine protein kinase [Candidatus Woesearchaeota archaeon]|nr:Kae1-associated serine/threonine protein kinase [Candidatus Woesearchaeota archaeon]